jgi:acetolactate synthase small subunit
VECIDSSLPTVLERLGRLACVRGIRLWAEETHLGRELVLTAVEGSGAGRAREIAREYGARVILEQEGAVTLEFAGEPAQAEGFLAALKPCGMVSVARSGIVALEKPAREEQK